MNILVTGGNGYIAKSLVRAFSDYHNITSVTRNDFDLSDSVLTSKWFKDKKFDIVIHTAAVGGSRLTPDGQDVIQQNLMMYYNLLSNKNHFDKFISFGSGAEIFHKDTPYGWSKKVIADCIAQTKNFYNIRIFGVFDENELDTRFIKANIKKYIDGECITIHSNKIMDFFYMKDLCSLVQYYIETEEPQKEIDAVYQDRYTLIQISQMINELGDSQVPIVVDDDINHSEYFGVSNLPIPTIGLREGIVHTYRELKTKKDGIL